MGFSTEETRSLQETSADLGAPSDLCRFLGTETVSGHGMLDPLLLRDWLLRRGEYSRKGPRCSQCFKKGNR